MFHPVQTDVCVHIACFGTGKMPSAGGVSGPRAAMGGDRPDNERMEAPAIAGNAYNCCN
jgi:hypothetical protein